MVEVVKTDIKRNVETITDFNPILSARVIVLPRTDIQDLKDVLLTIYGGSTVQPTAASRLLGGVENLQIKVNGRDVTTQVRAAIKRGTSALPSATLVQQYKKSAVAWVDHLRAAGLNWPEFDRDRKKAASLTASEITAALAKLGDRTFGWSGQIHPFNFLYTGIEIPALSFADIFMAATGSVDGFVDNVRAAGEVTVELFQSDLTRAGGRVTANVEMVYTNPLAELLEQALQALDQANRAIEDQRVNYLLPLRDELNRIKADLPSSLQTVSSSIDRIDRTIREIVDGKK